MNTCITRDHEAHLALFLTEVVLMSVSGVIAVIGIVLAYFLYIVNPAIPKNAASSMRGLVKPAGQQILG
jgi:hypothetical protein